MRALLPEGWAPPIGYANGIEVEAGRIVFIAGQVGWDAQQKFASEDIVVQFEQALSNVAHGAGRSRRRAAPHLPHDGYCCDKPAYLAARRSSVRSGSGKSAAITRR